MPYQFRIASPCSASWDGMAGDDRIRFCEQCNLHVYNFSAMTQAEINALVSLREGRLCARLYQRSDGTVLTKNCPVGFRAALLRASGFATATFSALLSVLPAIAAQSGQKKEAPAQAQTAPASLFLEVTDPTGVAIANVQVDARDEATNIQVSAKTDDAGRLRFSGLSKGLYELSLTYPGFPTKKLAHVQLPSSELRKVQLDLPSLTGDVVVVGELVPEARSHNPLKKVFSKLRHVL